MSRQAEARLSKLEGSATLSEAVLFLNADEDEGAAIAALQAAAPHSRLLVLRWARTDEEAISDPAALAA